MISKFSTRELGLEYRDYKMTYLIDNLIESNSLNLLVGPSNVGKTWISYYLSVCVSDGKDFFNHKTDKGSVLYFDNEMSKYQSYLRQTKLNISNLTSLGYVESDFPDITNTKEIKQFFYDIEQEVINDNLKLIVIDSLNACCSNLDENSNSDMRTFMDFASKLAKICTVLIIHHKGKSEFSEFRGASVIKDRCDNFFAVDKKGEFKIIKNRNGKKSGSKIEFTFKDDEYVEFNVTNQIGQGFEDKKDLSETIIENLEDGMNQTQLFEKMRSNNVSFIDAPTSKLLKNMKSIRIEKGPNNSSIYYHLK
jgi:predicted ATP-dependent serine protease